MDVVQFTEKRSQRDGNDAGDVFLGQRRLRMSGTLYGLSRPLLYDAYFALRAALSPVLAQREEPLDRGYRPLKFSVPTDRTEEYGSGQIALQVLALPRAFSAVFQRDQQGGEDEDPLAIPWQATFVCKDPSIMSQEVIEYSITNTSQVTAVTAEDTTDVFTKAAHGLAAGDRLSFYSLTGGAGIVLHTTYYVIAAGLTASEFKLSLTSGGASINVTTDLTAGSYVKSLTTAGTATNRGSYICPVNLLFTAGTAAGSIVGTIGDGNFTITVPASSGSRIFRFKGEDAVLTVEEDSVEVPRMDLITFQNDTTWPYVSTGDSSWSVTVHGLGVPVGAYWWFSERYA